jgi:hypothetical protein
VAGDIGQRGVHGQPTITITRAAASIAGPLKRRRHKIDPQRYLKQLLTNLPATPIGQMEQWLPDQ